MLYDESYEVRDGDTVQTPKHGSASAVHNRISIKSTPAVVLKQKSATEVTTQQHQQQQLSSATATDGTKRGNIKSEYLKRPATCLNGNNNNSRQYYENLTGLTRTLETSRATYRVGSSSVGEMSAAGERPASRNASGKTRPITPEDPETPGTEDDDDEEDDDEEYDNIHRESEETFQHIESIAKRELKGMKEYCRSNDSEDEDDDSDSSVQAGQDILGSRCRGLVSGSPSCGFPLKTTRTALGGHNNICVSSAALAAAASNLIPEDLFDVMNVSDGLVLAGGEDEDEEEDNEEERLRRYFTRQHFHEIQLDNKREEIRRKLLAQACESNSLSGVGIHRYGYWVYNPADYENLRVSPEIKEVFQFITKYVPSPASCQVDVKLKPFIPEYYPSVGDIDAFIKVIHPEVKDDSLGIKHLDEPSAFQSDPSVLDLRLRALAKQNSAKAIVVKKVENVGKNVKIIDNWINDISDLHRSKPSPSVHYSKPMPDIDHLIQEWPPEIEDLLKNVSLPPPDLDCDLATYVDIVCNLLDIPVYKSRIQSLHVLCTLYMNYKSFNQYGGGAGGDGNILTSSAIKNAGDSAGNVDRLEL